MNSKVTVIVPVYNTEKHISVGFEKIEDFITFYNEHLNELKEQIFLHSLQEDFN